MMNTPKRKHNQNGRLHVVFVRRLNSIIYFGFIISVSSSKHELCVVLQINVWLCLKKRVFMATDVRGTKKQRNGDASVPTSTSSVLFTEEETEVTEM